MRSNAAQIAGRMRRRAGVIPREMARAARQLGPKLSATSKRQMQAHIYSVKVPVRGKTPLWKRSGDLKRSEGWRTEGATLLLVNTSDHAKARFNLGTSGHRNPIYTFTCQWQWEAVVIERPQVLSVRREAQLRALRTR